MRIAFLQNGLMGYQNACLRALTDLGDEILVVHPETMPDVQFDRSAFGSFAEMHPWSAAPPPADELVRIVQDFAPDAVMMTAWRGKEYRAVMSAMRGDALRIMFSSNTWHASPQQWLGRVVHPVYLGPLFDVAFVPGERSEFYVRRLGFAAEDIIRGANAADVEVFERGPRTGTEIAERKRFLFSGRLVDHKAISVLAPAYLRYRSLVDDPWDLSIVGDGPLASELADIPGVTMHGFVQPTDLADMMHESSCLILPSFVDFWGVVVHEAGIAGLPLLCGDQVGAVPYLLQDGYNGWTVGSGSIASLTSGMVRMTAANPDRLDEMSAGSRALAGRLSPAIWARNLHDEIEMRLPSVRARRPRWLGGRSHVRLKMKPR